MEFFRDHAVEAVILWEMLTSVWQGEPGERVDAMGERLRSGGFRSATDTLDQLVGPVLTRWSLRARGGDLLLRHPSGVEEQFEQASGELLPGWREAASESGRVLMVYGAGFGFDRLSPARVDRALQAGEALCAIVPWKS